VESLSARLAAVDHPRWVEAMAHLLNETEVSGYFRWFSSGDLQSLEMLVKICAVCRKTPRIRHWISTREVGILGDFARAGFTFPDNLVVRYAADMIEEEPPRNLMEKLGVLGAAVSRENPDCPARNQGNVCGSCRRCWDKRVKIVTYEYH
jgi:hypothetical protein